LEKDVTCTAEALDSGAAGMAATAGDNGVHCDKGRGPGCVNCDE